MRKPRLGEVHYRKLDRPFGSRLYEIEVFFSGQWNYLCRCVDLKHARLAKQQFQTAIDAIIKEAIQ